MQLLEVPLENTLSQLTQAIRFLAANDFLQGVEAYAGEADERERDRNKITVVGESSEVLEAGEGPAKAAETLETEDRGREVAPETTEADAQPTEEQKDTTA